MDLTCEELDLSRRKFLKSGLQISAIAPLLLAGMPQIAFADMPTDKRLVVVFLRGGLDSLSTVAPYADANYRKIRGSLALAERDEELISISDFFAFHKNLPALADFYKQNELAVIHAVATPYRQRSHFDAQDLLENGTNAPDGLKTGWLNRTIQAMGGEQNTLGLSLGSSLQLMMQGEAKVASWSPSILSGVSADLMSRVSHMYQNDPLLSDAIEVAAGHSDIVNGMSGGNRPRGKDVFISMMSAAAKFLKKKDGSRIAAVDYNGFDTHVRQQKDGDGVLPNLLQGLNDGIQTYRNQTPDEIWKDTLIYVVTEFGRTVRPNGSHGTDHGTASLALAIGGAVNGGQVITQWPGLAESQLYEGRDLAPTTDLRSVSKNILTSHYGISNKVINQHILPGTLSLNPTEVL